MYKRHILLGKPTFPVCHRELFGYPKKNFYLESLLVVCVVTIHVAKFVIKIRIVQLIRIERLSSKYLLPSLDIFLTQYMFKNYCI